MAFIDSVVSVLDAVGATRLIRNLEGAVAGKTVEQQVVTAADKYGNLDPLAVIAPFSGSSVVSASGDTTLYTPSAAKAVRLRWIALSASSSNSAEVLAIVKIGAINAYQWYMGAQSAFSRRGVRDGVADAVLKVNLSGAGQNVTVNWECEEI